MISPDVAHDEKLREPLSFGQRLKRKSCLGKQKCAVRKFQADDISARWLKTCTKARQR